MHLMLAQSQAVKGTQPLCECRNFTFREHGIIQVGVDLGVFSVSFTWRHTENTALLTAHSRVHLGNWGLASAASIGIGMQTELGLL